MASFDPPVTSTPHKLRAGVPALRTNEGTSFLWRRLHSLSGIFPVGFYLVEHFVSNAFATRGPDAYNKQVTFLTGLPFVFLLELLFIYIPILYHSLYGFYIWYRGDTNVGPAYPWTGNWLYTAQRWTGGITFAYMLYHTIDMRFTGEHLMTHPELAFGKVQSVLQNPWVVAVYLVGVICASWHFSYGLWLFAAKWGITVGEGARRKFGVVCVLIAAAFIAAGIAIIISFLRAPAPATHGLQSLLTF